MCILKKTNDEYAPLFIKEWNQVYETLFGGFEDIDESSEERSMDSEIYSDEDYTKEGYLKDDFVVEDDELEEEEYVKIPVALFKNLSKYFACAKPDFVESARPPDDEEERVIVG